MVRTYDNWSHLFGVFASYLKLRRKKGLTGRDFNIRALKFCAARLVGPYRIRKMSPLIATLAVTSRCPLNCVHCSAGYENDYQLEKNTIDRTLKELVSLGCPSIALTGGEPLLRKDLVEIIDRIPSSVTVMIYTSGIGLSDELAADFAKRKNLLVCFSLDHENHKEHDRIRGKKGSQSSVLKGIEQLKGGKCEIQVSTIVTPERLRSGELHRFIRSLKKREVACVQLFQPRPAGRLVDKYVSSFSLQDELHLFQLSRDLLRDPDAPLIVPYPAIEHSKMLGCCGGYSRVHIDSRGYVCPCDFAPLSFGNVADEPFTQIWKRMRGFFSSPRQKCLSQNNVDAFGGRRIGRNVDFSNLENPELLLGPPPVVFERYGEKTYRLLASSLTLASVAACQRENENDIS